MLLPLGEHVVLNGQRSEETGAPMQAALGAEHGARREDAQGPMVCAGSTHGCMDTPVHGVYLSLGRRGVDDPGHTPS